MSSFATKLISFFLVPLYTNILTTTEYGTYDLFNTTVSVLLPILTLNIQESVIRFALDKKYDRGALVTVSMRCMLAGSAAVLGALIINGIFGFSETVGQYAGLFFLMFFSQALSEIVLAYTRGTDKIAELSISSVIASAVTIGCNLFFLLVLKWGLVGYFLASIIGPLAQCVYLMLRGSMLKEIHFKRRYSAEKKEMLRYCRPMIANSVAWWVNNASDRYVVIFFCGLAENGIYSVASKIPSILNIFQSIFNQAWTLSAVKDYDPEDKNGFFSNTYKAYNCLMVIICSVIICADKILARFLYANDFFTAWRYVPWLTIAIVFGALSGYLGGFFSAVKNSRIFARSSIAGAVSNVILNILLTPFMGALGAAVATAICYFEVWIIRYWCSKRYIRIKINLIRDAASYILLTLQAAVLLTVQRDVPLYGIEILLFFLILLLYVKDIQSVLNMILKKVNAHGDSC